MQKQVRAVLRNAAGEHLRSIEPHEIEAFELMAGRGDFIKSHTTKRGRVLFVFRMRAVPAPPVKASNSLDSKSSLNLRDIKAFVGITTMTQVEAERLIGHGMQIDWGRQRRLAAAEGR